MEDREAIENPDGFALSGLLPQICVDSDDPAQITEVTICSAISGRANEIDCMPGQLELTRVKGNAVIRATYRQVKINTSAGYPVYEVK